VIGSSGGYDFAAFDDHAGAGPALYVAGAFAFAGGRPSSGIARLGGCGSPGVAFCAGDGSATPCPCGNASTPGTNSGCVNSLGRAAHLQASGLASVGLDTLVLHGSGMTNGACLYFQGTARIAGGQGAVFGDGLRCAGGTIVRLGIEANVQGASQYPNAGEARISVKGTDAPGATRRYQAWYRDAAAFCTPSTFDLSNGLEVLWVP
jgi:hypothetical protein